MSFTSCLSLFVISLSLLFFGGKINFSNSFLVLIGDASSSTPTRLSSCLSTVTAWSLCPLPSLRSTSASETRTASCTWSTHPRRHLDLCVLCKKEQNDWLSLFWTMIQPTLNSRPFLYIYPYPLSHPPIQTGTIWTFSRLAWIPHQSQTLSKAQS